MGEDRSGPDTVQMRYLGSRREHQCPLCRERNAEDGVFARPHVFGEATGPLEHGAADQQVTARSMP